MQAVLYIIGGIWIVLGTVSVLYTQEAKRGLSTLLGAAPLKLIALIPLVMGALLMLAAFWSSSLWFVEVLGILAAAKGVVLFFLPKDKGETLLTWWRERASEVTWRFSGLIAVILGAFMMLLA